MYNNYCRSGLECVVKRLRVVLYKPDCDSNDCELQSEQATPSILDKGVACSEAACGMAVIPYPYDRSSGKMTSQSDSPGPFVLVTATG